MTPGTVGATAAGDWGKPFKDARFALARARDSLASDDSRVGERQRLAPYDATNLDVPLSVAYELKEAFRVAMALGRTGDVVIFTAALELFDALCVSSGIEAFVKLAKTLRGWRQKSSTTRPPAGRRTASPRA